MKGKNIMKKVIGIIFADPMEYSPFEEYVRDKKPEYEKRFSNESFSFSLGSGENEIEVISVKAGVGKTNVAMATALLIACDKADIILNAGLSGAVSDCLRGDILFGDTYVECDFDLTSIGYKPAEKPDNQRYIYCADEKLKELCKKAGLKSGNFGSGDIFLTDKEKKNYFKEVFSLNAFDMETGAIAAVCDKCGVPFISLRKMSDDAENAAYESYREMNEAQEKCLSDVLMNLIEQILNADL